MSNILWVEDFGGGDIIATVDDVLGDIINTDNIPNDKRKLQKLLKKMGVTAHINFQEAILFVKKDLANIDFIILDIDLDTHARGTDVTTSCNETIEILKTYYNLIDVEDESKLIEALSKLKQHAGFHLYVDLIFNHQYPRDKIIFCSNHGENLKTIKDAFKAAMMQMPIIYTKSNPEIKKIVLKRGKSRYAILRRGIIDGCKLIQEKLEQENHSTDFKEQKTREKASKGFGGLKKFGKDLESQNKLGIPFNNFLKDEYKQIHFQDMNNYLTVLAESLPLKEPTAKSEKASIYKLFVRTLSHEWERDINWGKIGNNKKEQRAFASIMKIARNWVTHSQIFNHLTEEDVAFLFISNVRAMFDLGKDEQLYEKNLFSLFESTNIDKTKLTNAMMDKYIWLSQKSPAGSFYSITDFRRLLEGYQKSKKFSPSIPKLIQGLYQLFWFVTSPGKVSRSDNLDKLSYNFNIDSDYCGNQKERTFVHEFAKHIYFNSFIA